MSKIKCCDARRRRYSQYVGEADRLGKMVEEKQAAYGDSVGKSPDVLRLLYPGGVAPDQYGDLMMVTRVIDKLFRIATQKDAFGEDPWRDIAGYALLSVIKNKSKNKEKRQWMV